MVAKEKIWQPNPWKKKKLYYMYEKFRPKKFHLNGNQDSLEGPATGKIAT